MNYRMLGRTGLQVSEIALGCSGYWGHRRFSEPKALSIVAEAFERGINFFDTGHNYSNFNAEPRLGRAIHTILSKNERDRIIISSKAGTLRPSTFTQITKKQHTDFSPEYIEYACAKSIKNLNCEYLDIFHLHGIPTAKITDDLLSRLASMKQKGMYRHLGINTHRHADMIYVCEHPHTFDVALVDLNVMQLDRLPIIERMKQVGVGVLAGTVLAQGHLISEKIGKVRTSADLWYLARALLKRSSRQLAKNAPKMRAVLASIEEMTAAQAAVSFVLENSAISSCVFGTTKIENLIEISDTSGKCLTEGSKNSILNAFGEQSGIISQ